MSKKILRHVWSVDNDPADIFRSDVVSMPQQTAFPTFETFSITIRFGDVPTTWTGSTCVPRVDVNNRYSFNLSFILDKTLQLKETPTMNCSSLAATINRYSQTYTFDIFKSYTSESVLSFLNNPFGDYMINCCYEPMLFSTPFLEQTPSRLGAFTLKFTSDFGISATYSIEFFTAPSFSIIVSSNIFNSYIYAEKILWREWCCFWSFDCGSKIKNVVSEYEVGLSTNFIHSSLLIGAYLHGNSLSAFKREYGYGFKSFPTEDSLVVDYCPLQVERCFVASVGFVGICDFADCSHSHLGREFKMFSSFTVNKVMELPIVKSLGLKSGFCDAVAGFVESFHSLFKCLKLGFGWNEFDGKRLLHTHMGSFIPYLTVALRFLPQLKHVGILGGL